MPIKGHLSQSLKPREGKICKAEWIFLFLWFFSQTSTSTHEIEKKMIPERQTGELRIHQRQMIPRNVWNYTGDYRFISAGIAIPNIVIGIAVNYHFGYLEKLKQNCQNAPPHLSWWLGPTVWFFFLFMCVSGSLYVMCCHLRITPHVAHNMTRKEKAPTPSQSMPH